jgi:DNA-binding MarR family transcriptional regulator
MGATEAPGLFDLLRTAGSVESFVEARLATVGLSLPKLAALNRLVEAGESLPLGQLAERLACVKSNVTQLVDRLEAEGFVSRTADPGDGRSRRAVITAAGRKVYEQGSKIRQDAEQEIFGSLSEQESSALADIIAKLDRCRHGG